jgi:glutathione S-transferase
MKIFGDSISGNCLKVKWTADYLGLPYEWIETGVLNGETRTLQFLAVNPAGQVPAVILDDGRPLAQSNAIIAHLAEGSDLIPDDPYDRAKMFEWMFWEQYSHEPAIAVARFARVYRGVEPDPKIMERGEAALRLMEKTLHTQAWFAGDRLSLADVSLVAYTRVAHEGGFNLAPYPGVRGWISLLESALGIG